VLALSDQAQWYNKTHLVPFGEYFPVPSFIRSWMRMMSLPYSDFTAGDDNQAPLHAAGQKVGVTICYEDAYGTSQLAVLKEATLLVNVTNDAWFGDSTARHQHLQISRMRALEAGRPLLRAANDGISGIIDSHGALVAQLPSFKSAVLTGIVQPRTGLTPYARIGNWVIVSLCFVLLTIAWVTQRQSSK
jgi:apolipoprotein N-acyltransferase